MKWPRLLHPALVALSMAGVACDSSGGDSGNETGDHGTEDHHHADETGHEEVPAPYAGQTNPIAPGDQAALDAGAMTWASFCASCHGDTGAGDGAAGAGLNPPATDFTPAGAVDGLDDDFLLWVISDGVEGTGMAGYSGSLTDEQIWQVVTFMRTLDG
ncbi:MAG: cytochrome c [Myxococcales bacterium]|nr:cytochrome c [Myxococcales bacterium]